MEDEDVLLENDPLAIYLKNQNYNDFETTSIHFEDNKNITTEIDTVNTNLCSHEDYQLYIANILKSELLLEEDYNILETYYLNNIISKQDKLINKISFLSSISLLGLAIFKYTNSNLFKIISPLFSIPLIYKLSHYVKQNIKKRKVALLLNELIKLTNIVKKCLKIIGEFSSTINYYSSASINSSTINAVYIRFVKQFYAILLNTIKLLAFNTSEIMCAIPLTIENHLKYGIKDDLFLKDEINVTNLKLLFELYVLVQSDFVKTLGLTFCCYLWVDSNCDINKLIKNFLPSLTVELSEKVRLLEKEYYLLRNYGLSNKSLIVRPTRNLKNSPSNYLNSYLHNAELHFQQLLCKSQDLQNILDKTNLEQNESVETIDTLLKEMEKQLNSSKNILDAVTKYFNQLQNKSEFHNKVTMPQVVVNVKTVENQEEELSKQDKLTYELYIPKEGLDLTELEVDEQRPVFSVKDLDYSGVLLQELKTILKTRNPDVFEENTKKPEINSESEDEEDFYNSYRHKNIFRPTQPIGLAENLQTINHVLAARKNMLQCEDTFVNSDSESV